jgi:dienelactone hydrolase
MNWLEQRILRRENKRWSEDNNRRILPFEWGVEHLGGQASEPDPRGFLSRYASNALARSDAFFATPETDDYEFNDNLLTFPSALQTAYAANNIAYAQLYPVEKARRAVIVLPHWNAGESSYVDVCRFLNRFGLAALRLSMPYHDRRRPEGLERADYMVSPNIGLTLEASRQAVMDVKRCARWLEQQGFASTGILGTSIGSSVAFIAMAHEPALRAGVFLHVSTYFADVVRTGLTTSLVWAGLRDHVTAEEIRHFWAPISPFPYVHRMAGRDGQCLAVSGKYDPSFLPEFSQQFFAEFERLRIRYERLVLPCGHYTLGELPFNYIAALRFSTFLRRALR